MIYHVSTNGSNYNIGSEEAPFKTINHAAQVAAAGDTVVVHEGVYREYVDPKNSGLNDAKRIVYTAAEGEKVVIKGSEIVTGWEKVGGTVWKKTLPNDFFGDYNPYATPISGDWMVIPEFGKPPVHTGEVYLNGKAMLEATTEEELYADEVGEDPFSCLDWLAARNLPTVYNVDPKWTLYRWRAVVEENTTTLFVNFREYDPNAETVEINVRECCFYPSRTGRSYITLRGFEIAHAACNFTPPTADQRAMVGPNWSKGWIIENNHLHDAKCSAISIGKEGSTGDNEYTRYGRKYCHYYQTESAFRALEAGWDKAHVGSHVIRNNEIHDCGQNAIVGNLGCVFSRIEHNHVYNINLKREFYGHEVAIIKLHAAIDVVITNNCIHGCHRGIWLDWQAQGARVTKNLFYGNNEDFFLEVTHGPCLVDHNVMLSPNTLRNAAHGTAYVHNLLGGNMFQYTVMERQHPYHFPHSTKVLGIAPIYCYDDRVLNNALLGLPSDSKEFLPISGCYKNAQTSEEFEERIKTPYKLLEYPRFPVWFEDNAISTSCALHRAEKGRIDATGLSASLEVQDGEWILSLTVPESIVKSSCRAVTTERLGATIFSEQMFENLDATPVDFTPDMFGEQRKGTILPGPFASLKTGENRITVWKK